MRFFRFRVWSYEFRGAERYDILSTNKGYLYRDTAEELVSPKRVFLVKHDTDRVLEEFLTITELGGHVLDVAVEHELYGQIRVDLLIESVQDAREFAQRLATCRDNPLKLLTDDCHYHTVSAVQRLLHISYPFFFHGKKSDWTYEIPAF